MAAAGDVALIIDSKGIIKDAAFADAEMVKDGFSDWVGQRWVDTVTPESKQKIDELLRDAGSASRPRARQVNHASTRGGDVPVQYSAIAVGDGSKIVAVGRDLRAIAALQRRLVDVQQSMERDYSRMRNSETRYRLLFQITSEPVLIVDGASLLISEANAAAGRLLGKMPKRLSGRSFPEFFDADGGKAVVASIASVRAAGKADPVSVKLPDAKCIVAVHISAFRQDSVVHFLVRLVTSQRRCSK